MHIKTNTVREYHVTYYGVTYSKHNTIRQARRALRVANLWSNINYKIMEVLTTTTKEMLPVD